jgi:hypothetical protein
MMDLPNLHHELDDFDAAIVGGIPTESLPPQFVAFGEEAASHAEGTQGAPKLGILVILALASLAFEIFRYCKERKLQLAIQHAFHHPHGLISHRLAKKIASLGPPEAKDVSSGLANAMIAKAYDALASPDRWLILKNAAAQFPAPEESSPHAPL